MSNYRRWYVPGGTLFFTLVTYRRRRLFRSELARDLLGKSLREIAATLPFTTVAMVLLEDHLHCVWTLPPGDDDYSTRWKYIKAEFTRRWLTAGGSELRTTPSQTERGNRGIWQRRFWEHVVDTNEELECVCDYIHYNPVKHGYVTRPWDWPHSTFRRFVDAGQYSADWGRTEPTHIQGLEEKLGEI
jgi:putative transposase